MPMNISMKSRVSVSSEVLLQEIEGEAVLLDLKSECYFGLDAVGTRIWRLIEQDGDLGTVRQTLLSEFDVEPDRLERDLETLVGQLIDAGLVHIDVPRC
jgi:hypothetical protein